MDPITLGDLELKNKKRWSSLCLFSSYGDMNKMRVKWLPEREKRKEQQRRTEE